MGVLWQKVWHDLWENRGRTTQVVLIIAMGAFAIGMIIGTRELIIPRMASLWQGSSPAMIVLWADPPVDEETLEVLERIDGVVAAEGYISRAIEWKARPEDSWRPGFLTVRDDYRNQTYSRLDLVSGHWPADKEFGIGQGTDAVFGVTEGSIVLIRVDDRDYSVAVGGTIYDQYVQPPSFGGPVNFYTTRDRYQDLTGSRGFNRILAGAPQFERAAVTALADEIQDKLERQGVESGAAAPGQGQLTRVSDPSKHFFQDFMDGIFLILGVMAILALLLGLLLVYNTIDAIISQQIDQIGILKAIGARTGQVFLIYLVNVFIYGVIALIVAMPLGTLASNMLSRFLLSQFNAPADPFTVSSTAVTAQVVLALVAPLLASLKPVTAGARITVREAISTYGLSSSPSLLDRLLARARRIPRLVSLTFSNTFRNKERVVLTQITMVMSGLMFMAVVSVGSSVRYTFEDVLLSVFQFDISLAFEEPERVIEVEEATLRYPGVTGAEMWIWTSASIRPAGQPESEDDKSANSFGVPVSTGVYVPQIRGGRWLEAGDSQGVVLNQVLASDVGVAIGDWVTLDFGIHGTSDWEVVGLLFDPVQQSAAYLPQRVLEEQLRTVGRADSLWIQTEGNDPARDESIARGLRDMYDDIGVDVRPMSPFGQDTAQQIVQSTIAQFNMFVALFGVMAIVIGAVGAVALSGVLTLNVLERRREIGVMRAIGSVSRVIGGMFVGEGLLLGWLSWLIALPLSIPAGRAMTEALGAVVGGLSLVYRHDFKGAAYWLIIVTMLSVLASLLPARGAIRVSVRESLAYE